MKRLIVHIGPRKTGSTSIQQMLAAPETPLRAHGAYLPRAGTIPANRGTHVGLAREARGGGTRLWERLADEVRATGAERVVLSAEDFSSPWCRARAARRLADFAARESCEVDILAYVRPQWQIVESEYSQRVCGRGLGAPFGRFADDLLAARDNTILDYNVVFAPFREAFGARVHVFPLEPSSLPGGLRAHFLAQIGIPSGAVAHRRAVRTNVRRGAKEIEVRRALRERVPKRMWHRLPALGELAALIEDDAPFAGFTVAEVHAWGARFAAANRRLALDYGIDAGGTLFRDDHLGAGRRPNVAHWEQFDDGERRRLRRHVHLLTGIDLDGIDLDGGAWHRTLYRARHGVPALTRHCRRAVRRRLRTLRLR